MRNELNMKLRGWEKDDRAEKVGIKQTTKHRSVASRLDMLLGFSVASLIFSVGVLLFHVCRIT